MMPRRSGSPFASPHAAPLLVLFVLSALFWGNVLFGGQALLPGEFLRGFAPFGADARAPWNILQWDAMGQYYPWRHFAAEQLRAGSIPLWNPHQFAGTPFVANGQSAIFYPLNLPFWLLDVAYAFGVAALLHTLLATWGTYFLAHRWGRSRAASLLAAIAFGFCGYLTTWVTLPTLANTASWLPLLLLLLEWSAAPECQGTDTAPYVSWRWPRLAVLALALTCALLAGHAQVFFYLLIALVLRALLLAPRWRSLATVGLAAVLAGVLGALQLLPTLELSRLSHRAAQSASAEGWAEIAKRGLQPAELVSLVLPQWPLWQGTLNENFGYVGIVVALFALLSLGTLGSERSKFWNLQSPLVFTLVLAAFGLLYALATPLPQLMYFTVPGLAQMGGVGRALILWSLGAALLAAYGLDVLRNYWKSPALPAVALFVVTAELFAGNWNMQPTAPRAAIYPQTTVTKFLQDNTRDGSRVLLVTPRRRWAPTEVLQMGSSGNVAHPPGALPPNGAMVYGLRDISGYDSLALRKYRDHVARGEIFSDNDPTVSPQFNGNMVLLNNPASPLLDKLNVRYVVTQEEQPAAVGREVLRAENCYVYERTVKTVAQTDGATFAPGWREGRYQPQSFRFGSFLSLCGLALVAALLWPRLLYHLRRTGASGP